MESIHSAAMGAANTIRRWTPYSTNEHNDTAWNNRVLPDIIAIILSHMQPVVGELERERDGLRLRNLYLEGHNTNTEADLAAAQTALAKERAIMSHVLEGGGEELTLPEAVFACELRSKQAEAQLKDMTDQFFKVSGELAAEREGADKLAGALENHMNCPQEKCFPHHLAYLWEQVEIALAAHRTRRGKE